MSILGIVHTAISVLPVGLGLAAYVRHGKIDPATRVGQSYLLTMVLGTVTGWGFIFTKGFNPAQVLGLLTLATLALGVFTLNGRLRQPGVVQTLSLSASYFLLWFFTTTETLTRIPVGHPFASGPTSPELTPVRLVLLGAFLVGVSFQLVVQHTKAAAPALPH